MRHRRAPVREPTPAEEAQQLRQDKLCGMLLGACVGEALGSVADGLTRDQVMRRHRRIVRWTTSPGLGVLAEAAVGAAEVGSGSEESGALAGRDPASDLVVAGVRAVLGPDKKACGLMPALARHAFLAEPFAPLRADAVLRLLEDAANGIACDLPASLKALAALAEHVRSPPFPTQALAPWADLPRPAASVIAVAQALLVRPGSSREAILWAVNLGGEASLRATLVGVLTGVHRGASGLPEAWLEEVPPAARDRVARAVQRHGAIWRSSE